LIIVNLGGHFFQVSHVVNAEPFELADCILFNMLSNARPKLLLLSITPRQLLVNKLIKFLRLT